MDRQKNIHRLAEDTAWDIAVVGGGSSGLGVALDALSRGLKVILLEKADFAKGTSSRSTKLVHGGVRYLAQGNVQLVWEALQERGRLLKNAPHLTHSQAFIIPIYSSFDRFWYLLGLKLYDLLAGQLSLGKSSFISREETIARLPTIRQQGLKGGVVYYDGQFDDARLALNVAQTCDALGGCMLNYMQVNSFIKDKQGQISGLSTVDALDGKQYNIRASMVVNATGIFADEIIKMDDPGMPRMIQPSQGIHLVIDKAFLGGQDAILIPETADGRVLFAIPWHNKVVIGTTDTLRKTVRIEPAALSREIDFVLKTASTYLVGQPRRGDVLSVFAGLRPLAAARAGDSKTKDLTRSHRVIVSASKLVTLTGGKWTTFRKMGEDTVNHYYQICGKAKVESRSRDLKIYGYTEQLRQDHLSVYGKDADGILKLMAEQPRLAKQLHPDYPYTFAEVVWAVRMEMAMRLEDVLSRRTRLLILDAKAALASAPAVAALMAAELGKGQAWIEREQKDFEALARKYIIH